MFLLLSQHVSAYIGHRQVIREEYTNDNGIYIKITVLVFVSWIRSDPA
jgi:hypothetical protein